MRLAAILMVVLLTGCATMFDPDAQMQRAHELAAKAEALHLRFEADPSYTSAPERTRWHIDLLRRSAEQVPRWIERGHAAKAYYQLNDALALARILDREMGQLQR